MGRRVRIPVRVVEPSRSRGTPDGEVTDNNRTRGQQPAGRTVSAPAPPDIFAVDGTPALSDSAARQDPRSQRPATESGRHDVPTGAPAKPRDQGTVESAPPIGAAGPSPDQGATDLVPRTEMEEWRDRALRLQADMENYRRRQRKVAQDEIKTERQRLLRTYLGVIDDLDRALSAADDGDSGLRQGIELTRRGALQLLRKEGVEKLDALGHAFDPNWHEAVATVRRNSPRIDASTIVEVVEPGYRMGDELLRPARVVVAV